MSERQLDIADMQCWVFLWLNPNGKCPPATALNYSENTISLVLSLNATTFFI